ncbi:MAG TPA: SsrA-binding protein SmpB [Actinomycetota bacterium]|nr:SsrA-binding protein SmpB [Actinomycetota bacterium]
MTPAKADSAVATNRRARRDYDIQETFEAGIVLTGSEVKSLRTGRASLSEAYARVAEGEVWLENLHIPPYSHGDARGYDPRRPRKLLLHRKEIERLVGKTQERGLTLVPLRLYFTRGLAKLQVGLGRGKREYEKRQAALERMHRREAERAFSRRQRGA